LEPPGFVWGNFPTVDGARLRWGHLPAPEASADCVLVGGFAECIEKYFETIGDLTARGYSVWCLDWRGQGGSERPRRLPSRPRPRRFDRDAGELAAFTEKATSGRRPRLLIGHSMGGTTALLCLRRYPGLFDAAVLSAPMLGINAGGLPPALMRCMTGLVRATGLGICSIPGAGRWGLDRSPTPELSRVSNDPERCRLQHAWFSTGTALRVDARPGAGSTAHSASSPGWPKSGSSPVSTPRSCLPAPGSRHLCPEAHHRAARLLPDCTLVEFPESKHEPFLERDAIRDRWFAAIDQFVAASLRRTRGRRRS
jgi:lysophospholipase